MTGGTPRKHPYLSFFKPFFFEHVIMWNNVNLTPRKHPYLSWQALNWTCECEHLWLTDSSGMPPIVGTLSRDSGKLVAQITTTPMKSIEDTPAWRIIPRIITGPSVSGVSSPTYKRDNPTSGRLTITRITKLDDPPSGVLSHRETHRFNQRFPPSFLATRKTMAKLSSFCYPAKEILAGE